jgi:thioredoxin
MVNQDVGNAGTGGTGGAGAHSGHEILEATDKNFEEEVLKSEVPVLVDFWAVWCGPCRAIAPSVEALASEYKGKIRVAKMDVDKHVLVPQKYDIRSIPTLLVFKGGKVVQQIIGAVPRGKIEEALKKALAA